MWAAIEGYNFVVLKPYQHSNCCAAHENFRRLSMSTVTEISNSKIQLICHHKNVCSAKVHQHLAVS